MSYLKLDFVVLKLAIKSRIKITRLNLRIYTLRVIHHIPTEIKMADLINFVSKREIDAKKEQRRRGREEILRKV